MSKDNGKQLDLTGDGAAYVRVSDDQQDTLRQYEALRAFEKRHGVTIPKPNWFKDEGWARDTADRRPDFQRLVKLAEAGQIRWIVVDKLDRFGTKNSKQLIAYLYRLDEAGCRLYDASGKEWTGEDIATIITAVVEGEKSKGEQTEKSHRILGGKVSKARLGEWQGGPVRLGFDVACHSRETKQELWRVILDGRHKRVKVWPDGRQKRFDGKNNFPKYQPATEVLRITPSRDEAKLGAVVRMFQRFATESITLHALAHDLNGQGFRTGYGGFFQGRQVEEMLTDPNYLGYYTWNRLHCGKFHRWSDGRATPEENYGERLSHNDKADWIHSSERLFAPLIDRATWDAVQRKLDRDKPRRENAPRCPTLFLAGLVYCGHCGAMMTGSAHKRPARSGKGRRAPTLEFFCSTYRRAVRYRQQRRGTCLRNAVLQRELEQYVERYLEETGKRLELLTQRPEDGRLTDRLEGQREDAWQAIVDGMARLESYLAQHHPDEWAAIVQEDEAQAAAWRAEAMTGNGDGQSTSGVLAGFGDSVKELIKEARSRPVNYAPSGSYFRSLVNAYRANFDPAAIEAELTRVRSEHDRLVDGWQDLPTKRAKDTAAARLKTLDARLGELEQQRQDVAGLVEQHCRELNDLQTAIGEARKAIRSEAGERALRQRAEAVRAVIQRIECSFTATGETGGGPGKKNVRLTKVTIYPVVGEVRTYPATWSGQCGPTVEGSGPQEPHRGPPPRPRRRPAAAPAQPPHPLGGPARRAARHPRRGRPGALRARLRRRRRQAAGRRRPAHPHRRPPAPGGAARRRGRGRGARRD
jgi:DNA invertase Pin-like site-specific DNA recombinase